MKRSDFFIRLTTGVLFLAIAIYIGASIYFSMINTFETEMAMHYTIEETISAEGFIIRTETILEDSNPSVLPVVNDGERVGAGQTVAVEFMTAGALEVASEIRWLNMQIAGLDSNRNITDAEHLVTIRTLSEAVSTMDFRRLEEITMNIETTMFDVSADVESLRSRLSELEVVTEGTRSVIAPVAGTFTQVIDGFEHIASDMVFELSPDELLELFQTPKPIPGAGKLITEFKWYFAAIISNEDARHLEVGSRVPVSFFGPFQGEIEMRVERVDRSSEQSVVLLSSDRRIHDVTQIREIRAEIVINTISGIRIPKEALRLDENANTFVFLLTSAYAERVDVEILGETGDSFILRDGAQTGSPLRADSIIVVRGNDLYHGKVVG